MAHAPWCFPVLFAEIGLDAALATAVETLLIVIRKRMREGRKATRRHPDES